MTEEERLNLMIYGKSHPEFPLTSNEPQFISQSEMIAVINRLRAENEKLREALNAVCQGVISERGNIDCAVVEGSVLRAAAAAIREDKQ